MFAELLAHPGVEEVLELRGRFGFMAYHGGSLEEMTDVIAPAAAEQAGRVVLRRPPARRPAVAHPVDRDRPGRVRTRWPAFLDHVDVVVTVHGYGREGYWATLLLGGQQPGAGRPRRRPPRGRPARLRDRHRPRADPAAELRGLHPRNPVNLPRRRRRADRAAARGCGARARCGGTGTAPASRPTPTP